MKLCECGCGEPAPIATESNKRRGHVKGEPMRFVRGHAIRGRRLGPRDTSPDYAIDPETGCWIWRKGMTGNYGCKVLPFSKSMPAHRWYYQQRHGELPEGKVLHHKCETPACVNPDHLVPLTRAEHVHAHRRDACRRGHPYSPENTYVTPQGYRQCRACKRLLAQATTQEAA